MDDFDFGDESRRSEFQSIIWKIVAEDEKNYYALGDIVYDLKPVISKGEFYKDWRRRDINRIITRYREDRPIEDARRWAKIAIFLALIALASSLVSAITDFSKALDILLKLFI